MKTYGTYLYSPTKLADGLIDARGKAGADANLRAIITELRALTYRTNSKVELGTLRNVIYMLEVTKDEVSKFLEPLSLYLLLGSEDFKLAVKDGFDIDAKAYWQTPVGLIVRLHGKPAPNRNVAGGECCCAGFYKVQ